jgi:hypothetical protein
MRCDISATFRYNFGTVSIKKCVRGEAISSPERADALEGQSLWNPPTPLEIGKELI